MRAIPYSQYFGKGVAWMKMSWRNAVNLSEVIIAISEYVKNDIINSYAGCRDKINVIYHAIVIDTNKYKHEKS